MGGVERACEACGRRAAAEFCEGCALCYCGACSARRHGKGAFTRHTRVELPRRGEEEEEEEEEERSGEESTEANADERRRASEDAALCDECGDDGRRAAEVECAACELRFCAPCADDVHRVGAMQLHVTDGSFRDVKRRGDEDADDEEGNESDSSESPQRHVAQLTKLLQDDGVDGSPRAPIKQSPSPFFAPVVTLDGEADQDPDQEMSPTPPTKSASSSSEPSYDLWGSWSMRAFKNSGEKSDGAQWRGLRSLSIVEGPSSASATLHEDELVPLSSITKSLRSLSFASDSDDLQPTTGKRTLRPRSLSDYTSLGSVKLNDIWGEHIPQLHEEKVSSTSTPLVPKLSVALELFQAMETAVASRHVIIKTDRGGFDATSLKEVIEALKVFGAIAALRDEFAYDGVLFCTFFELKAAIGAVKLWFTNSATTLSIRTSAHFSLPYETPNDINCATVLVQLHGVALAGTFSDMRQICSRFGEVASVLGRDSDDLQPQPDQYIVEFNDARDVNTAMARLSGSILPCGLLVTVSRFHPPTLDLVKVQAFHEASANQHGKPITRLPNRPKSYSESTTIVTSPSSTSSSPLHGPSGSGTGRSEEHPSDAAFNNVQSPGLSSASTPFIPALRLSSDTWRVREPARPRSSSAFASLSSASSGSLRAESDFPSPADRSETFLSHSSTFSPHYRTSESSSFPQPLNPRPATIRSGSDPGFRHVCHSYASSNAGSTTNSLGRNDQGTGEFTLSIDKVISGEDSRTTLMVRNIPNKYTQQMLLAEINVNHHGKYDFFYLPIDFKNKCNMGYAFINFIEAESIVPFYQEFDSQKWTNFNSEKVCAISYARLQGKQAMITRFQNSSLLEKHESYRPLVFYSSGPNRGKPEPFPSPKPHQAHYVNRKPHNHHQHAYVVSPTDEYLRMQTSHLYAQRQQLQHAANVLHGHALLANAHAAAAAMLHTMPGLGISNQYPQSPSFQYGTMYHQQHPSDRRYATPTPYTTPVMPLPRVSGAPSYGGYNVSSPFSPTSS